MSAIAEPALQTYSILVVDDFEPVARLMSRMLRRAGHRAISVCSASAALEICRRRHFDILISDIVMGATDGWTLMPRVRAEHPDIRGIAVSALHAPEHVWASAAAGFALHMPKPIDIDQLLESIDSVMCAAA